MRAYSSDDLKDRLHSDIYTVLKYLLPHGKQIGQEYCVGSLAGEPGESLKVRMSGGKVGVWSDFNGGQGGDIIDLWAYSRDLDMDSTFKEIRQWLGIGLPSFSPPRSYNWTKPKDVGAFPKEINNSPVYQYLINERKLSQDTLFYYNILELGREIVFRYDSCESHELVFTKYQHLDRDENGKKRIRAEANCQPCLFGWGQIPRQARSCVLVEGEIDAMTLFQYGLDMAVLSVPFGGGSGAKQKWVEFEYNNLSVFDVIYLCLDDDEAGHKAIKELQERLGQHRCRIVKLPYKDANECLQRGVNEYEIKKCFTNALSLDPEELINAADRFDEYMAKLHPNENEVLGYNLPWFKAQGKVLLHTKGISVWTGINGHGKSQALGQVMLHCMKQGAKVCIASLESPIDYLMAYLTRQASGMRQPSYEYARAINDWYREHLWLFDLVGTAKSKRLLEVFEYARYRYGIDVFVIDSFMKCGIGEEDLNGQKAFMEELCDFKNKHNCHIHLVVHPRKPKDESEMPCKLDMKGTGALSDLADNCFTVWRNKSKEANPSSNPSSEADCKIRCDKQRHGEWEGTFALWFDLNSRQYLEYAAQKPVQMIEYSNRH